MTYFLGAAVWTSQIRKLTNPQSSFSTWGPSKLTSWIVFCKTLLLYLLTQKCFFGAVRRFLESRWEPNFLSLARTPPEVEPLNAPLRIATSKTGVSRICAVLRLSPIASKLYNVPLSVCRIIDCSAACAERVRIHSAASGVWMKQKKVRRSHKEKNVRVIVRVDRRLFVAVLVRCGSVDIVHTWAYGQEL